MVWTNGKIRYFSSQILSYLMVCHVSLKLTTQIGGIFPRENQYFILSIEYILIKKEKQWRDQENLHL